MPALLALAAMLVEGIAGYPDGLFRRVGHPVVWIGRPISTLERRWNRGSPRRRRLGGVAMIAVLTAVAGGAGAGAGALLPGTLGLVVAACLGSSLIAQRSLAAHVRAVAVALETGGLAAGREAVSRIVGRDPEALDEAGVARAAVESLAENFSDGVVAPVAWMAVAGLGGAAAYKAINTADSMVGHRSPRFQAFGWAAARLDDLVNLPASRLASVLLVAAAALVPGASPAGAARAIGRDARRHRSPNAGWPEAAMAGALGFALAGPRHYGGVLVEDAVMGAGGRRELGPADIRRALRLYWVADALLAAGLAGVVIATG
ncbi:MAG: adenosylcobinamide-phosphate synthase CbiB [Amaricoccus sp.]|uniref:adenosylcobinamide-phosphate synthase CbiB n=1 Tax=Amaricoccus sp. TaxID=1872485 RepID=UPI0039E6331E